jgi:hypothetical protein
MKDSPKKRSKIETATKNRVGPCIGDGHSTSFNGKLDSETKLALVHLGSL